MRQKTQLKNGRAWRALALGLVAGAQLLCRSQATNVSGTPEADAFVRSLAPTNNYGGAGSLSVSGSGAVNGSGQQNGLFDALMRFPTSDAAAALNHAFGSNGWVVTGATLVVNEVGAPNNSIFNRGVGAFEIRWISAGAWPEGSGTPIMPTTDGVAYQDLASVLNPAADVSLGRFTNNGADGPLSFPLAPVAVLGSNILAGRDLNFYLTAASTSVGFTFNSRNFGTTSAWPNLTISAVAKPLARITTIERLGANQAGIRFNTVSNWTCVVQGSDGLPAGGAGAWFNLYTVPARLFDDQAEVVDTPTNRQRFYRLLLSW